MGTCAAFHSLLRTACNIYILYHYLKSVYDKGAGTLPQDCFFLFKEASFHWSVVTAVVLWQIAIKHENVLFTFQYPPSRPINFTSKNNPELVHYSPTSLPSLLNSAITSKFMFFFPLIHPILKTVPNNMISVKFKSHYVPLMLILN